MAGLPKLPRLTGGPWSFPLIVVLLLVIGWVLTHGPSTAPATDRAGSGSSAGTAGSVGAGTGSAAVSSRPVPTRRTTSGSPASGTFTPAPSTLPTCAIDTLPAQARTTSDLIRSGGPFPYVRDDGKTFRNNGGLLPSAPQGYYREYTVKTPGASNRGTRRIITGGDPATNPPNWYYTGDHYDSFCALTF